MTRERPACRRATGRGSVFATLPPHLPPLPCCSSGLHPHPSHAPGCRGSEEGERVRDSSSTAPQFVLHTSPPGLFRCGCRGCGYSGGDGSIRERGFPCVLEGLRFKGYGRLCNASGDEDVFWYSGGSLSAGDGKVEAWGSVSVNRLGLERVGPVPHLCCLELREAKERLRKIRDLASG